MTVPARFRRQSIGAGEHRAGVELPALDAALLNVRNGICAATAFGLPARHHEAEFDEFATRQRALLDRIKKTTDAV